MLGFMWAASQGNVLAEMAEQNPDLVVVTQDMGPIEPFAGRFPDRYFDVGISEANLIKKAETLGDYAKKRLNEMYYKYQIIGDVRGKGLMLGIELVKDRKSKEPAQKEAETVRQICFQKGVVLLAGGTSCIRFCPPGVITTKQVDFALDVFESALETVYRNLGWKNIAQGRQLE